MKAVSVSVLVLGLVSVLGLQVAERNGWLPDLLAPPSNTLGNTSAVGDLLCGPKSLHIALNLIGCPVSPDEIVAACTIRATGVSFGDLAQFAKGKGLSASLQRLAWEDLLEMSVVGVLFVDDGHYVTVDARASEVRGGKIRLFDPGHVAKSVDSGQLTQRWNGDALILSAGQANSTSVFESYWHDGGFVSRDVYTFRIPVTNRGGADCTLKVLETSCQCTTASLGTVRLAPGGESFLEANLELTRRRGYYQEKVRVGIVFDGSTESVPVDVWLCGGRYADALCRSSEFLGEIPDGADLKREVYVHDPGDGTLLLDRENCRVNLQGEETKIDIPCTLAIERVGKFDSAIGSHGLYPLKAGDYRLTIAGAIPLRSRAERLLGTLKLSTDLPPPLNRALIQLSGRIVSRLDCEPSVILLSKTDRLQRVRLAIRNQGASRPGFLGYQLDDGLQGAVEVVDITGNGLATGLSGSQAKDVDALVLEVGFSRSPDKEIAVPSAIKVRTTEGEVIVPVL